MHYLYRITNQLNGKVYIGQSNKEKERWRQHKYFARQNAIQYIHRAMAKYGIENFAYEVIAMCKTPEDADEIETQLITQYDSREKGYNISLGGDPAWNRGLPKERQPMYGKKQSDYQKQRCAEVHTGLSIFCSEETKKKMSTSHMGHLVSQETRQKLANASGSRRHTDNSKKKMSKSHVGLHVGEKSPRAKLTWEIVRAMRKDYVAGMKISNIAQKYGVNKGTAKDAIREKTWKE